MNLEDITKKYPFIYEVGKEYYYLGHGICEKCKSRFAIEYFEEYKSVLGQIGRDVIASKTWDIDEVLLNKLIYNFGKVKAYSNVERPKEENKSYRQEIMELIDSLEGPEQKKLLLQLEDFVNVFYYYYNRL